MSRVFATGLGDQNMVIEDVTIETETSREKQPKATEVLGVGRCGPAFAGGSGVRCRTRGSGVDGKAVADRGVRTRNGDHKGVSAGRGAAGGMPRRWGGGRACAVGAAGRQTHLGVRGHLRVAGRAHRIERAHGAAADRLAHRGGDRDQGGCRWPRHQRPARGTVADRHRRDRLPQGAPVFDGDRGPHDRPVGVGRRGPQPGHAGPVLRPARRRAGEAAHPRQLRRRGMDCTPWCVHARRRR